MSFSQRTEMLLGEEGVARLSKARVAVFGVGGVGGHCAEALGRAGIGHITLIDADVVSETNLNRQIVALRSTIGRKKAEVMRERLLDINPGAEVAALDLWYDENTASEIDLARFDFIADAIDTVSSKLLLITRALKAGTKIISCMGAGARLDPSLFRVADIYETSVCPLARVMRSELRRRGVLSLPVVFSPEEPVRAVLPPENGRRAPGSVSYAPAAAGLNMAAYIIRALAKKEGT